VYNVFSKVEIETPNTLTIRATGVFSKLGLKMSEFNYTHGRDPEVV
jgi:hypothetical protein